MVRFWISRAERCYKLIRNTGVYHRMDNLIVIKLFIFIISIHMKQFINGICIFLRHLFANLGTGILGCHLPADLYQPVEVIIRCQSSVYLPCFIILGRWRSG